MVTISDLKWTRLIKGFRPEARNLVNSNAIFRIRDVKIGAAEAYVTGGLEKQLRLSANSTISHAFGIGDKGHIALYDVPNNKLKIFTGTSELTNNSRTIFGETFSVMVFENT